MNLAERDDERPARPASWPPRGGTPRTTTIPPPRPSGAPPRPSRPPHAGHPVVAALRLVFAALWIGSQLFLIAKAGRRDGPSLAVLPFRETNLVHVVLSREVEGSRTRVHAEHGAWNARGPDGAIRRFSWHDRVKRPELAALDRPVIVRFDVASELAYLQAALDDVAAHLDGDTETRRLHVHVTVRRNGHAPEVHHLVSVDRPTRGGA